MCRLFRSNISFIRWRLGTIFGYTPIIQPPAPSMLRQLAYQEHLPTLVGPDGDPDGFEFLEPAVLPARVFDSREIEVTFKVSSVSSCECALLSTCPFLPDLSRQASEHIHLASLLILNFRSSFSTKAGLHPWYTDSADPLGHLRGRARPRPAQPRCAEPGGAAPPAGRARS
jgi:hypothetical protein